MYNGQSTIDSLLGEHVAIRGQMQLLLALTREWEKLLESKESIFQNPEKLQALGEKFKSLKQALGYFEDGLKNHHQHEDQVMPPLVGNLLMKAIWLEHGETLKMSDRINSLVINNTLENFLKKGTYIMQLIDELAIFAGAHSSKEDGILLLLKKLPELK